MKRYKVIKLIFSLLMITGVWYGCTKLQDDLPTSVTSGFKVHPTGWNDSMQANFHGVVLRQKDWNMSDCISCHGNTYQGGTSRTSCYLCHNTFPHVNGWNGDTAQAAFHGKYLKLQTWNMNACKSCHGNTFLGDSMVVSCYDCHTTFPHVNGWATDTTQTFFHGKYLAARGWNTDSCSTCHGNNLQGGTSGVSCSSCHVTYPHVSGWMDSTQANFHGNVLKNQNWNMTGCKTCHGSSFLGGTSNVSCYSCHSTFPHLSGFESDTSQTFFHGKLIKAQNRDMTGCTSCHGSNYQGGTSGKSCFTCHSSFPHSGGWADSTQVTYHGNFLKNRNWNMTECQQCHGNTFQGGTSEVSCSSCHSTFPHEGGWSDSTQAGFHGKYLKDRNWNMTVCQSCHGSDYRGGISNISCYSCHSTFPHASDWADDTQPGYHGNYLEARNWNMDGCKACHGSTFQGGSSQVSCYTCHSMFPHVSGWVDTAQTSFHGSYVKNLSWDMDGCKTCHGSSFQGGTSHVACNTCHQSFPHPSGWTQSSPTIDPNFHGVYLRTNSWNLPGCQSCHGSTYSGSSRVPIGCMTSGCHTDASQNTKTPEACNTCHGTFLAQANDITSWSPPRSVMGDTLTTSPGVGAHRYHLSADFGKPVKCQECHTVPGQVFAGGHLDSPLPAEVTFSDTLANLVTGNGSVVPNPSLNTTLLQCSNVFCHGNWGLRKATSSYQFAYVDTIMVGNNYSPLWTGTDQAACGTCHDIPPKGHQAYPRTQCVGCHGDVIDANGNISNPLKHINGKINMIDGFGGEKIFR